MLLFHFAFLLCGGLERIPIIKGCFVVVVLFFLFQDSPFYSALFYPGQKVAGPARAFKEAKWLSGVKPIMNNQAQVKGIVEEVRLNRIS